MEDYSLDDLRSLSRSDLFAELRSFIAFMGARINVNVLLRFCTVCIEDDEGYYACNIEPYIVGHLSHINMDEDNRATWLSYNSDTPYDLVGNVLSSFNIRFLEIAERITSNRVEDMFLEQPWSDSLEHLAFSSTFMGDAVFRVFCEVKSEWPSLINLDVIMCNLDDESMLHLEEAMSSGSFPVLRNVYAADNTFGDSTMELMHRSRVLQRLSTLDITGSLELTEENLREFALNGSPLFQSNAYVRYNMND